MDGKMTAKTIQMVIFHTYLPKPCKRCNFGIYIYVLGVREAILTITDMLKI